MEIKKEGLEKSQIKLTIEVPTKKIEEFFDQATKRLSQQVKISGFRPGKAPRFVIEKEVGSNRFNQEVLEIAITQSYFEATKKEKIIPIAKPEIKVVKFAEGNPLVYEARIAVIPEITFKKNYRGIIQDTKVKPKEISISEKDVEGALLGLQKTKAKFNPTSDPVQKGNRVEIDFDATSGGAPIERGSSRNHPLVVGDDLFVVGFEDKLIGMKKDEQKKFSIVFPKDYPKKELAGKKVDFKVTLKGIWEVELPALDNKFAKKVAKIETIGELKNNIREKLKQEAEHKQKLGLETKLIDKVMESTDVEIPQVLIEEELQSMISEIKGRLESQGLKLEQYLKNIKKTEEEFKKEQQTEAERRIKAALVLNKIAEKENIQVTDDEVEKEIENMMKVYQGEEKETKEKFSSGKNKQYIKNLLRNQKTIKRLVEFTKNN